MAEDYKCNACGKEFKNKWRMENHECIGVKKVDLGSVTPAEPVLINIPVPARPLSSVPEPEPILENPVPLDPKKHSRNWDTEMKAQTPKRLHKYM